MEKLLLRPSQVADLLGLGRTRIYRLISIGEIPSFKIGSTVHVPADGLQAWIGRQEKAIKAGESEG